MKKIICITLCLITALICFAISTTINFVESIRGVHGTEQTICAHGKSMGDTIPPESVVTLDTQATPHVGDIVCFIYHNDKVILHRVVNINGQEMTTKGDGNKNQEEETTPLKNVVGVYKTHYPYLGYLWKKDPTIFNVLSITCATIAIILIISIVKKPKAKANNQSAYVLT